jgi:hypothetical protein
MIVRYSERIRFNFSQFPFDHDNTSSYRRLFCHLVGIYKKKQNPWLISARFMTFSQLKVLSYRIHLIKKKIS